MYWSMLVPTAAKRIHRSIHHALRQEEKMHLDEDGSAAEVDEALMSEVALAGVVLWTS